MVCISDMGTEMGHLLEEKGMELHGDLVFVPCTVLCFSNSLLGLLGEASLAVSTIL